MQTALSRIWTWFIVFNSNDDKDYTTSAYIYKYIYRRKVGDHSWGWLEGSLFNSNFTEVYGRALLLFLDCSTLPLMRTIYCWVLSKEVSSTIFKVFGMTQPGIEPRSPGPLVDTLPTRTMRDIYQKNRRVESFARLW